LNNVTHNAICDKDIEIITENVFDILINKDHYNFEDFMPIFTNISIAYKEATYYCRSPESIYDTVIDTFFDELGHIWNQSNLTNCKANYKHYVPLLE